jgi:hypothetical protein
MAEGIAVQGQVTTRVQRASESGFVWPEEIPWSVLGEDFVLTWGHDQDGRLRAEHWEIEGQSGSGKSYLAATAMQARAAAFDTPIVAILTKQTDDSIPLLGWPDVGSYQELRDNRFRQAVFWPATDAVGEDREQHHEAQIRDLLTQLWPKRGQTQSVVVYLDEIRYLESLSPRMKKLIRQYWREGRSHGISLIAGAQRPLEMVRDMHSEARWRAVFCPSDEGDMERFAELLGPPRDWEPVLRGLDQQLHQFVLRNSFTKDQYISWVDTELRALPSQSGNEQRRRNKPDYQGYAGARAA